MTRIVVTKLLCVAGRSGARYRGPDRRVTPPVPVRPVALAAALGGLALVAAGGALGGATPAFASEVGHPGDPMVATAVATLWILAGAVRLVRSRVVGDVRSLRLALAFGAAGLAGTGPVVTATLGDGALARPVEVAVAALVVAAAALLVAAAAGPEIDTGAGPAGLLGPPLGLGILAAGLAVVPGAGPVATAAAAGVLAATAAWALVVGVTRPAPPLAWAGVGVLGLALGTVGGAGPAAIGALVVLADGLGSLAGPYRTQRQAVLEARVEAAATHGDLRAREAVWAETAHDARSALLAAQGATRALARRAATLSDTERERLAAAIDAELDRARGLVGGHHDRAGPVRLVEVLGPLVTCRQAVGQPVTMAVPDELTVLAQPSALREVVANLLDNAARHAPGAPVELSALATPGDVRVVVADRGPGVPQDRRELIFERGITARPEVGSGLGLHVARRLARAGGGDLWVEEAPGGGAAFVLVLPSAGLPGRGTVSPGRSGGRAEQLEGTPQEVDVGALQLDHAVPGPGRGAHP